MKILDPVVVLGQRRRLRRAGRVTCSDHVDLPGA
jgi:hypothetical protein